MRHPTHWPFVIAAGCVVTMSCGKDAPASRAEEDSSRTELPQSCDAAEARRVVEQFGERLKQVSLLAPDSIVIREIREAYGLLVTSTLLETWTSAPARAPGRKVSSPWPERIEIRSIDTISAGTCRIEGDLSYATSANRSSPSETSRESVVLQVVASAGGWRISAYAVGAPQATDSTAENVR
jgi:hypothetical protein